jgi:hypothetical protein
LLVCALALDVCRRLGSVDERGVLAEMRRRHDQLVMACVVFDNLSRSNEAFVMCVCVCVGDQGGRGWAHREERVRTAT